MLQCPIRACTLVLGCTLSQGTPAETRKSWTGDLLATTEAAPESLAKQQQPAAPKRFRMAKGKLFWRSTPVELVNTTRFVLSRSSAASRLRNPTKSVCSGPLPPFHLQMPVLPLLPPICMH